MWCFNDENVARKIASSPVPIISAVGHEIDFTISDFVADLRAPTPSAAAELVVKNTVDLKSKLNSIEKAICVSIGKKLKFEKQFLLGLRKQLIDPKRRLQDLLQRNDELSFRLNQSALRLFSKLHLKLSLLVEKMSTPDRLIEIKKSNLQMIKLKLENKIKQLINKKTEIFNKNLAVLDSLSPLKVIERGYSMTFKNGQLVRSVDQLNIQDEIQIKLAKGEIVAIVKNKIEV